MQRSFRTSPLISVAYWLVTTSQAYTKGIKHISQTLIAARRGAAPLLDAHLVQLLRQLAFTVEPASLHLDYLSVQSGAVVKVVGQLTVTELQARAIKLGRLRVASCLGDVINFIDSARISPWSTAPITNLLPRLEMGHRCVGTDRRHPTGP